MHFMVRTAKYCVVLHEIHVLTLFSVTKYGILAGHSLTILVG